jgi:hypothetical protein
MQKDGDAMKVHDEDRSEAWRRHGEVRRDEHDVDWQGARRAAAAGNVHSVEHGAVLRLQRLAGNAGVGSLVESDEERRSPVLDVVGKGGGAPLPADVRGQMEAGLGADFGDVRVHDTGEAAASAQAVNAKAYTVGNEVVFNRGAYQPGTAEGQHTLAHELTHVVQQRSGPVDGTPTGDGVALSDPHDRFEREAEATASSLGRGEPATATPAPATGTVQRQEEEEEPVQSMSLQRQEEEEEVQATPLQRQEEEEEVQSMSLQRQEEEEEVQATPLQREEMAEEEEAPGA